MESLQVHLNSSHNDDRPGVEAHSPVSSSDLLKVIDDFQGCQDEEIKSSSARSSYISNLSF